MRLLLIPCALLALAACQKPEQQAANQAAPAAQAGPVKGVDRSHKGKPAPEATFNDPDGGETSLAQFSGKPVLVNLGQPGARRASRNCRRSITWLRPEGITVVAVSQDCGPHASVEAFLASHKIVNLASYQDPKSSLSGALGPDTVLPTTILFDGQGKEVWRYVGDLVWTSPEAARLIAEGAAPQKG